jgi:hypothetical protein
MRAGVLDEQLAALPAGTAAVGAAVLVLRLPTRHARNRALKV